MGLNPKNLIEDGPTNHVFRRQGRPQLQPGFIQKGAFAEPLKFIYDISKRVSESHLVHHTLVLRPVHLVLTSLDDLHPQRGNVKLRH